MSSPDRHPAVLPDTSADEALTTWRAHRASLETGRGRSAVGPWDDRTGKVRSTPWCLLLMVVTFGLYVVVWSSLVHREMYRHTHRGVGGGAALVLSLFLGVLVMPFVTSDEVGNLHARRDGRRPVSWRTGLWAFPGCFLVVLPLVWFVRTNEGLNDYWRSVGAT